jgi:hypothetical protein
LRQRCVSAGRYETDGGGRKEGTAVQGTHENPPEESSRFLKKAAQKLFLCWAMGVVGDKAHSPN